ncbi:hypothetical protein CPB84DRAFT_1847508 [Gymnopilus junonius]|uniref:Uncharacterized protein n=1 Tax=Gymnopilus junonius TaxID=109634 RepID=A0A9P5TNK5_GYMJU|nr:hypothetical protein CPB84DRAFT_1847508 [Gymnopilus junonius]
MEAAPAQRPGSIRSVASNSSLASGVSLSRRPRTRTRSRTVTGSTERRPEESPALPLVQSDLPYLAGPIVQEPLEDHPVTSSQDPLTGPPTRPPRSPQRLEVSEIRSSDTASMQVVTDADPTFVEPLPSAPISGKPVSKAAKQASTLPLIDTGYKEPPSAFSRDPALTPVVNIRDSVSTQQSGVSSSLYPPSTSTASGPESPPSPRSLAGQVDVPPFALEVNEVQEYDSDDVSYRLRLLVKNNYFLPPAHSKPSPEDLGSLPVNPPKPPRSPAPFLNLFGIGKAKSKPATPIVPTPGFDPMLPMLRTPSDSIAAPYALRSDQPRTSSQFPRASHIPNGAPRGRVVVVREKVNDIAIAAKQAEQDLRARGAWVEQSSQKGNSVAVGEVIDPTDAVDVPLPSPSYPFAVQASALHGLGVMESLGADVLADRLPPGQRVAAEDSWRKALLHQAVHHSLDNTPDISTYSHALSASTSMASPLASPKSTATSVLQADTPNVTQQLIQQKIVSQLLTDDSTPTKHSRQKSGSSTSKAHAKSKLVVPAAEAQELFHRVETPSGPMTPLGPPPRRHFVSQLFSLSQTDLTSDLQSSHAPNPISDRDSRHTLRKTVSSPSLAEDYDTSLRHHLLTPPPLPMYTRDSQATITYIDPAHGGHEPVEGHSDEVDAGDRSSLALSALNRPSLSEYSQSSMSPTTSTFQDMLNQQSHSRSSSSQPGPSRFSADQESDYRASPITRATAMSPPPRISSSLAHVALPPPPRSSCFNYHHPSLRSRLLASESSSPQPSRSPAANSEDSTFHIPAPEPTTPPLPPSEPDPTSPPPPLPINLSVDAVPQGVQSAAGPSTHTSFFDSIQSQPNAMDDLDSSSDESDDEEVSPLPPQTSVDSRSRAISSVSATNPRPQIMKHGNFSAPYIRSVETPRRDLLPLENDAHSKKPAANIVTRLSKNPLPSSSYDFFKYAEENPLTSFALAGNPKEPRRPSTVDNVNQWRNNQKAQESLRKLDGMLIQHMEVEKDTIKRIATHLKQTATSRSTSSQLPR